MQVLKIVAEGLTTSFRYPHFIQQVQPSFSMPPPATIYGHIASALGEWFDPQGVQFAYHFTYAAKTRDIEHTIILSSSSGKLKGSGEAKVLEGNVNPFKREIFFFPRLTLYLNRIEWEAAFRNPRYAVVLGRSQDLFAYRHIEVTTLVQADKAYFEHTLLPYQTNRYTNRGVAVTMPRYLDNQQKRFPSFSRYFIVQERIHSDSRDDFLWIGEKRSERFWIDPSSPEVKGAQMGLAFLSFVGAENEAFSLAG
ncbi:MAG: CRISPR-associated protein Cas5 [Anaerolineae bacterium]|nr:CRISPR-associated protein Cas5 [Anaerolineae bacterium]